MTLSMDRNTLGSRHKIDSNERADASIDNDGECDDEVGVKLEQTLCVAESKARDHEDTYSLLRPRNQVFYILD